MRTKLIQIELSDGSGSSVFVFGMRWHALTGEDSAIREIRKIAREEKAEKMLAYESDQVIYGFLTGRAPKGQYHSAAAAFARFCARQPGVASAAALNALLFHNTGGVSEDGEPEVAIIGIKGGVPEPPYDQVLPVMQAIEIGREFVGILGTKSVETYLSGDFDDSISHINEFYPQAAIDNPFADVAPESLTALGPVPANRAPVYALAGLLGVGMAGFGAYAYYQDVQAKKAAEAKRNADPVRAYVQSRDAQLRATYSQTARRDVTAILEAVNGLRTRRAGWLLNTATCDASGCTVNWLREFGTNASFAAARPEIDMPVYALDFKALTHTVNLHEVKSDSAPLPIALLPTEQTFLREAGTGFQVFRNAGLEATFAQPALVGIWSAGKPPAGSKEVIKSGAWKLGGELQWLPVIGMLPDNMTLTRVVVKNPQSDGQAVKFEADGRFFVR